MTRSAGRAAATHPTAAALAQRTARHTPVHAPYKRGHPAARHGTPPHALHARRTARAARMRTWKFAPSASTDSDDGAHRLHARGSNYAQAGPARP